jgi:hypothetical protein
MIRTISLFGVLFFFCLGNLSAQTKTINNNDSIDVVKKMHAFIDDFNNLNWDNFQSNLAETITVFLDSDTLTLVQGKIGVEQIFKGLFDNVRSVVKGPPYLHIQPLNLTIQMLGETSIISFHMVRGKYIIRRSFVWQKFKSNWLIVHMHGSSEEK